ncbi:MFS transporter [Streptomyces sp. NPDC002680]|uniref:MFS transporter n=1 Tax=Streptomyces sp. NPDC002680 TaxID=3364659 RepID=UPI0036BA328A
MTDTPQRDRWLLVAAAGLAVFMATIDMSIVNVAMPAIQKDLDTEPTVTEWVAIGYFLPLIALALPSGRWLDRVGKRAALGFAATGFGVASVACGLSPTIEVLIGARVAQGLFGSVLFAMTPVLATLAVRPEVRGRALSVFATLGPLGAVSGPAVGGLLISGLGWQWIFYVNVPVCAAVVALGMSQIAPDGPLRIPGRDWFAEAALLGAGTAALMLGLSFTASEGLGWLALSALAVPFVWIWARRPSSAAPLSLLRTPGVTGPLVSLLTMMTALAFVQYLAPFFLDQVLDRSAGTVAATVLAFPLAMGVCGPISGVLTDRWNPRLTMITGATVATVGLLLLLPLDEGWQPADVAWRLAVIGAGVGLFTAPNQTTLMSNAPKQMMATVGAGSSLIRQLGLSLGPALATLTWALNDYRTSGMRIGLGVAVVAALIAGVSAARRPRPAMETSHGVCR